MSYSRALAITVLGIVLMSFESLLIKSSTSNAFTFSFYVSIFLFLSTFLILFSKYKNNIWSVFQQSQRVLLFCAICFTLSNLLFILSIKHTTVANASLIFSTAPIFSAFYMYVLFKIKSGKNVFISSFFIGLGLTIIFLDHLSNQGMLGNIYALICVLFYALSFVLLSRYTNIDVYALFCLSGLFGSINSFILAPHIQINGNNFLLALATGLIIVPISRILVGKGTKILLATEVSLLMVLETILAPLLVWLVLKEMPSQSTFLGGSIILLTLIINSLYLMRKQREK